MRARRHYAGHVTVLFENARTIYGEPLWLLVDAGHFVSTGSGDAPDATARVDLGGRVVTPGFIDLHAHGAGGHGYDSGPDEMRAGVAVHRAHGTTRSLVSLVANPLATLRTSLATIAELSRTDPTVLGSHLEGPFLAADRRGAHNLDFLRDPSLSDIDDLLAAADGTLRLVTLAPELPGAMEAIDAFVAAGVTVAIGHTEASYDLAREAFDRGASMLTHAFNAMPGIHHRAPGPVVAAFEDERVTLEIILDGQHVHPDVAALAFTAAPGRIALVTDAMAAAGSTDGDYTLGSLTVSVVNGLAVLRGTSTIAGSTLTQDAALRIALDRTSIAPAAVVAALSSTPARAIGLSDRFGMLAADYPADFVVLSDDLAVDEVWVAGSRL
ncbi:N-acetylglucosamine-6-phosphate deacetylase [Glaciihabitans arcticus]|uniref:N-acetylglucosamine-6-phosphate deacetylase n=1 Tax=Glaciihabitans arcticus TaxID=2668039 RepID=A0A4Q9GSS9_9MICO|nr:N-acetylglucosamine-6-phosphate deacetylase [Glaciihabitans arcticus]